MDNYFKASDILDKAIGTDAYFPINSILLGTKTADVVPKAAYDQIVWERDMAVLQLRADYGVGLGEKKADVAPVRHGQWIPSDYTGDCCYTCSECGFERDAYLLDVGNYCPNCGARMDKEDEHEAD